MFIPIESRYNKTPDTVATIGPVTWSNKGRLTFLVQYVFSSFYGITQSYGHSTQCGRPVGARCSMGLGRNPLINGSIQHTFKLNFLLVEQFTVIPLD